MMRQALIFGILFVMSSTNFVFANNNPPCSTRDRILNQLGKHYNERPIALGLAHNGGVIEVLSSGHGGTFTLMITMQNKTTCLLVTGQNFEMLPGASVNRPPDGPSPMDRPS